MTGHSVTRHLLQIPPSSKKPAKVAKARAGQEIVVPSKRAECMCGATSGRRRFILQAELQRTDDDPLPLPSSAGNRGFVSYLK